MIQESLYNYLVTDSGVSAITTRCYPLVIPQQSYEEATRHPCLVYRIDGQERQVLFANTNEMVRATVTIDSYARTYAGAHALAAAVRGALVDYSGQMATVTSPVTYTTVKRIFLDQQSDLVDIEPGLYRVMQQYTVWYHE